jgi:trehalose synthase
MAISQQLQRYTSIIGKDRIEQITNLAQGLVGLQILHLNTTARGGGVAETLRSLLPFMEELQIHHTWKVIPLDEAANRATTHLVDLLQGNEPGNLSEAEQQHIQESLLRSEVFQQPKEYRADIYCVHDFQLVPLAALCPWMSPAVWFCHVDTAAPNAQARRYVEQFLPAYRASMFNSREAIFADLPLEQTLVTTPGIDPFAPKHQPLGREEGLERLRRVGIDTNRPLISQISRFDRWKNPWQVIDVYRQVKQQIPGLQVALVGAMEAKDDIRAQEILKDVQTYAGHDPDIHLLSDASLIRDPEVNAFQRYSDVVLQRSTREGFGLTATEAMWKNQPVVGTSATGLRRQIVHEQNGFIVDDTEGCAACTLKLLQDRALWQRLGEQAHARVQNNFLLPMTVQSYLEALARARGINAVSMAR